MKMIRILLITVPFITSIKGRAQEDSNYKGIQFEKGISWEQIKQEARNQNKYIFMDCYTTWCAPCRQMEREIYPLEKVGKFFNKEFICVKVQIDQTKHDNQQVRSWYNTAKFLASEYKVTAYPTYLFFTPEGKLVHRAAGGFGENQFITLAKNSMDPSTQYYTILSKYSSVQKDTGKLKALALEYRYSGPELAGMALKDYFRILGSKDHWSAEDIALLRECAGLTEAKEIANDYIRTLSPVETYLNENIHLISTFTSSTSDYGFKALYDDPDKADSALGMQRYARNQVTAIIRATMLDPQLERAKKENKTPRWSALLSQLERQFGKKYALSAVLQAKIGWFASQHDTVNNRKALVNYLDKYLSWEGDFNLNNFAWYYFQHVTDPTLLEKALEWSREAISINPYYNWLDTYANLLYKLKQKQSAIRWEEVAEKLEPNAKDVQDNLNKMKAGQPTWPR